jgi:hypothetical protein
MLLANDDSLELGGELISPESELPGNESALDPPTEMS